MPVWGWELLADLPDPETRERARLQMVYTLAEYVVAIQQPAPAEAEAAEPESTD
jgi:hypothetical protein